MFMKKIFSKWFFLLQNLNLLPSCVHVRHPVCLRKVCIYRPFSSLQLNSLRASFSLICLFFRVEGRVASWSTIVLSNMLWCPVLPLRFVVVVCSCRPVDLVWMNNVVGRLISALLGWFVGGVGAFRMLWWSGRFPRVPFAPCRGVSEVQCL